MSLLQQVKVTDTLLLPLVAIAAAFLWTQPVAGAANTRPIFGHVNVFEPAMLTQIAFICLVVAAVVLLRHKTVS